ncbi:hypothetical protein B566_EDAN015672 [Ephemera danica]|nr:hypothetical protein B566_EDAN015672 [Ephemera danica]
MRFFISLVLSFGFVSVQAMSHANKERFDRQMSHMSKNRLPKCSDGPIEAIVPSTDLTVIKEMYNLAEYVVSPLYIKVKVCGAMVRDLNIFAGTCTGRSTCQPREIRLDEIYFHVLHVKNNIKQIIPVTINNQISCDCK